MSPQLGGGHPAKYIEAYQCTRDCYTDGGWDRKVREGRGCTRPKLPVIKWAITGRALLADVASNGGGTPAAGLYRGRRPDPDLAGVVDLMPVSTTEPHERSADGCPGGWYRTAYCDSVSRYTRERTDQGARNTNPFFDDAPWQVQEAVIYLELEQARWQSHRAGIDFDRWERSQPKKKRR